MSEHHYLPYNGVGGVAAILQIRNQHNVVHARLCECMCGIGVVRYSTIVEEPAERGAETCVLESDGIRHAANGRTDEIGDREVVVDIHTENAVVTVSAVVA